MFLTFLSLSMMNNAQLMLQQLTRERPQSGLHVMVTASWLLYFVETSVALVC